MAGSLLHPARGRPPWNAVEIGAGLVDGVGRAGIDDVKAEQPVEVLALPAGIVRSLVALVGEIDNRLAQLRALPVTQPCDADEKGEEFQAGEREPERSAGESMNQDTQQHRREKPAH